MNNPEPKTASNGTCCVIEPISPAPNKNKIPKRMPKAALILYFLS